MDVVLIGGGSLAVEVASYLTTNGIHNSVPDIVVTDVLDRAGGRTADLSILLGNGVQYCRSPEEVSNLKNKHALVCVGDSFTRRRLYFEFRDSVAGFASYIHPQVDVASTATLGNGIILAPFACIGAFSRIADNSFINMHCVIGHDVLIGHSTVVAPQSSVLGGVQCGEATYVGSGVVLQPGVTVGRCCKIASGAVLNKNFGYGFLLHGNPAN